MTTVIIVIHLMVVVAMVGLVLLQRSEGGALGIGGGSGAFMTGRGAANVLTRSTGILATVFFLTSFSLALLGRFQGSPSDIFDSLTGRGSAPVETPAAPTPIPAGGGSAEEMLRQLGGSAGPQTPPSESGGASTQSAPAADTGTSLPVPDSAPAAGFDSTPAMGSDSAPAMGSDSAPTMGSDSTPTMGSDGAPADGGASPQTPPAQ